MISVANDVLWLALVLGAIIVVHEFGHYLAARMLGIPVVTFSIGCGPRLAGFRRGPTEFQISTLPFGGYVIMAGKKPRKAFPVKRSISTKSPSRTPCGPSIESPWTRST